MTVTNLVQDNTRNEDSIKITCSFYYKMYLKICYRSFVTNDHWSLAVFFKNQVGLENTTSEIRQKLFTSAYYLGHDK